MQHGRTLRRSALLALSLLSACAASDLGLDDAFGPPSRFRPTGVYGAFLSGRYAASRTDMEEAADRFLAALDKDPRNPVLRQQAFLAAVMAGRSDPAGRLARQLPDNPAAQIVLADQDARAGRWTAAEARYAALPRQGLTQILQPLLAAWAQHGGGNTDGALQTLQPLVEGQRFRGVYALHAAMIADQAGRTADAARLYRLARQEYGGLNLRLGTILASWYARQGQLADAQQMVAETVEDSPDLAIARPALEASVAASAVPRPTDGIAEAYLAMAAGLRQQDGTDFALLLLRLAIDLRPGFTAARLLVADIQEGSRHHSAALAVLADVPADDPLQPVVRLRRAQVAEAAGQTEEAQRLLAALARDYPDRPEPLAVSSDILRRANRYADAAATLDQAIARVPRPQRQHWILFYQRGTALDRAGRWDRAEQDFDRALQLYPDQPYVLNYLGYSWTEQGRNLPQARQLIERALQQRPNDGSIVDSLGWVLLRQGDLPGALRNLERAVELQPEDATINAHFGDALLAAGRQREAEFQWRRALNLRPEADEAARIEAKLRDLPGGAAATIPPAGAAAAVQPPPAAGPGPQVR